MKYFFLQKEIYKPMCTTVVRLFTVAKEQHMCIQIIIWLHSSTCFLFTVFTVKQVEIYENSGNEYYNYAN